MRGNGCTAPKPSQRTGAESIPLQPPETSDPLVTPTRQDFQG